MHWAAKEGQIPKDMPDKWEAETPKGKKLPETAPKHAVRKRVKKH